jgi:hypothetical protein
MAVQEMTLRRSRRASCYVVEILNADGNREGYLRG